MRVALIAGSLALGLGVFASATVHGQSSEQSAADANLAGKEFFARSQYREAESAWLMSLELGGHPQVAVGVAEARERQGNVSGAIEMLERYLTAVPDAVDRLAIEARIADLKESEAALAPHVPVITEEPAPMPAAPAAQPPVRRDLRPAVWSLTGVSAASLVSSTVLRFLSRSDGSAATGKNEREERLTLFSNVTLGVSALTGLTALVLYLVPRSKDAASPTEASFEVAPQLGPTGSGVSARVRF